MVTGAAEVAIPDRALLLAVGRALGTVHVEDDLAGRPPTMHPVDPGTRQIRQGHQIGVRRQPLGLEAPHLTAGCGNAIGNWNQDAEILGFTYGFVYDVLRSGNSKGFYVQVDQVNEYDFGTASGPGAIGNVVDADAQPFLVRI